MDSIGGGSGNDVISVFLDITDTDAVSITGDGYWRAGNDYFDASNGDECNQADVFFLRIRHHLRDRGLWLAEKTDTEDFMAAKAETAAVEDRIEAHRQRHGSKLGPRRGSNSATHALKSALLGGSKNEAVSYTDFVWTDVISSAATVNDFDVLGDTAVFTIDDIYNNGIASTVTGVGHYSVDNATALLQISLADPFVQLYADDEFGTIRYGLFEDEHAQYETIGQTSYKDIMDNTWANRIWVHKDNQGELQVRGPGGDPTLFEGFDNEDLTEIAAELEAGEGVLIVGDYGGGVIYGNNLTAVAGTNSDDIIYSGAYDSQSGERFAETDITAFGGMGDDTIFGSEDDGDALFGGAGNDYLHIVDVDGAVDELYGGLGLDVAAFGNIASSAVTGLAVGIQVNLGATDGISTDWENTDEGYLGAPYAVVTTNDAAETAIAHLHDIEGIDGTGYADHVTGNSDDNLIYGNGGNDTLIGQMGNDTLNGGSGADLLQGGDDDDSLIGGWGLDTLEGGDGHDTLEAGQGWDILVGGDGDDSLVGGWGNDTLDGGVGQDTIVAGDHDDYVTGGDGDDDIEGGDGSDEIHGGEGNDTISGGKGADLIFGVDGNDDISGDNGDDTVYGGHGFDTIDGGGGDDILNGGPQRRPHRRWSR